MTQEHYDVIILGVGLVGSVVAKGLVDCGLSVAVVDPKPLADDVATTDLRTTAVSYGSYTILKKYGFWEALALHAHPIEKIEVFEAGEASKLTFDIGDLDHAAPAMGFMIHNTFLRTTLNTALKTTSRLHILPPATVMDIKTDNDHSTLVLSTGETLTAHLVVGAEGRGSPSRSMMNIRTTQSDYGQTAMVATIAHTLPHNNTAFEVFDTSGPLAFLPLPDFVVDDESGSVHHQNRSALVWSSSFHHRGESLKTWGEALCVQKIEELFPYLGSVNFVSTPGFFPLSYHRTNTMIAQRYAMVGDAAHGMHPVAGQGVNLGWRDADALIRHVTEAYRLGLDIGSSMLLNRYNQERYVDQRPLMKTTHILIKLFEIDHPFVKMVRSYGLGIVGRIPFLKRFMMRRAMGI